MNMYQYTYIQRNIYTGNKCDYKKYGQGDTHHLTPCRADQIYINVYTFRFIYVNTHTYK